MPMTRNKDYYAYLINLFFFKLAVGAILLATSWDSLTLSQNSLLNISLLMALSFTPATFARPLFNKLSGISLQKLLPIAFWISALLILIESHFIVVKSHLVFTVNFILWIFIFFIEVSSEKWYVTLSQDIALKKVRKLSGISTGIAQTGMILGPVLVLPAKTYNHALIYWIISATLIIASLTPLLISNKPSYKITNTPEKTKESQPSKKDSRAAYVLAFAMIWPTLAIFNISAPVLSKIEFGSINVAGTMEMLIGLATALAGFLHPLATKLLTHKKRVLYIFFTLSFFTLLIYFYPNMLSVVFIGTFFTGLTFGYLRVELRTFLSRRHTPKVAGEIVAAANSWSGPLVLIYCLIFYFNASSGIQKGVSIAFPISFIIAGIVFCLFLLSNSQYQEDIH